MLPTPTCFLLLQPIPGLLQIVLQLAAHLGSQRLAAAHSLAAVAAGSRPLAGVLDWWILGLLDSWILLVLVVQQTLLQGSLPLPIGPLVASVAG